MENTLPLAVLRDRVGRPIPFRATSEPFRNQAALT